MTRGLGREGGHRATETPPPKTNSSGSSTALSEAACLSEPSARVLRGRAQRPDRPRRSGSQQWNRRERRARAARLRGRDRIPQHRRSRSPCEAGPDQSRTARCSRARRIRREGHRERHASDPARLPRRSRHGRGCRARRSRRRHPCRSSTSSWSPTSRPAPNRNSAQPAAFASLSIVDVEVETLQQAGPERLVAPADVGRVVGRSTG